MQNKPNLVFKIAFFWVFLSLTGMGQEVDSTRKVLDLSKQRLTQLPEEVFRYPNLEVLILKKNKIQSLPDSGWEKLPHLRYIDLSRNKLSYLPSAWGQLPIDTLILNRNFILRIPDSFQNMDELIYLDLWSNEVDRLPEKMNDLPRLKLIDMRGISMNHKYRAEFLNQFPKIEILVSPGCDCK